MNLEKTYPVALTHSQLRLLNEAVAAVTFAAPVARDVVAIQDAIASALTAAENEAE